MELRPKALAVYEAVLDLLDGGADLNSITVSEIAERAGIGKGTAYEYFSSKEDMVASAIMFEINRLTGELEKIIGQEETFEKKIYGIFGRMALYSQEYQSFSGLIRLIRHSFDLGKAVCQEVESRKDEIQGPQRVLTELYQAAVQEKLVEREPPRTIGIMTLIARFFMYMMYLEKKKEIQDVQDQEMRRYLYQGILSDLRFST